MHINDIKALIKDKGLTNEQLLKEWFYVYVLNKEKKDVHAEFALRLGVTREEGKSLAYFTTFQSPYLQYILRGAKEEVLESIIKDLKSDLGKEEIKDKLIKMLKYREKMDNNYLEKYQMIS